MASPWGWGSGRGRSKTASYANTYKQNKNEDGKTPEMNSTPKLRTSPSMGFLFGRKQSDNTPRTLKKSNSAISLRNLFSHGEAEAEVGNDAPPVPPIPAKYSTPGRGAEVFPAPSTKRGTRDLYVPRTRPHARVYGNAWDKRPESPTLGDSTTIFSGDKSLESQRTFEDEEDKGEKKSSSWIRKYKSKPELRSRTAENEDFTFYDDRIPSLPPVPQTAPISQTMFDHLPPRMGFRSYEPPSGLPPCPGPPPSGPLPAIPTQALPPPGPPPSRPAPSRPASSCPPPSHSPPSRPLPPTPTQAQTPPPRLSRKDSKYSLTPRPTAMAFEGNEPLLPPPPVNASSSMSSFPRPVVHSPSNLRYEQSYSSHATEYASPSSTSASQPSPLANQSITSLRTMSSGVLPPDSEARTEKYSGVGKAPQIDYRATPDRNRRVETETLENNMGVSRNVYRGLPTTDVADSDPEYWKDAVACVKERLIEDAERELQRLLDEQAQNYVPTQEELDEQASARKRRDIETGAVFLKRSSRLYAHMDVDKLRASMSPDEMIAIGVAVEYFRKKDDEEKLKSVATRYKERIGRTFTPKSKQGFSPQIGGTKPSSTPSKGQSSTKSSEKAKQEEKAAVTPKLTQSPSLPILGRYYEGYLDRPNLTPEEHRAQATAKGDIKPRLGASPSLSSLSTPSRSGGRAASASVSRGSPRTGLGIITEAERAPPSSGSTSSKNDLRRQLGRQRTEQYRQQNDDDAAMDPSPSRSRIAQPTENVTSGLPSPSRIPAPTQTFGSTPRSASSSRIPQPQPTTISSGNRNSTFVRGIAAHAAVRSPDVSTMQHPAFRSASNDEQDSPTPQRQRSFGQLSLAPRSRRLPEILPAQDEACVVAGLNILKRRQQE